MNNIIIPFRANLLESGTPSFANTKSLSFDGVDDYVSCGNITELDNVTSATWSIWSNSLITTSYHYLMSCYSGGFKQYLFKQSTNKLDIFLSDASGSLRLCNTINFTFTVGVWYHVAIVYDETEVSNADKVKVYIDGALQSNTVTGFALTSLYVSKGLATEIGKAGGFTSNQYNGNLDEVCILDRAATPTEIVTLSTAPTVSLTDLNPIAWYRNGDNGSWKSPQWLIPNNENFAANKVSNYSLDFDGVDDYVNCGDSNDFSFGNGVTDSPFSISFWTKIQPTTATTTVFIGKDSGGSSREYAIGMFSGARKIRFFIKNQGGNNQQSVDSTNGLLDNTWYNVICTYDGSGGNNAADGMNIYINGSQEILSTVIKNAYTAMNNTTAPLTIGKYVASASQLLGNLDEVSVYNTELSAADALAVYNSGQPTTISGATAHYKMGENATLLTNWTVPDEVGSNTGTSVNMNVFDRVGEAPNSSNNALSLNMDEVDRVTDVPT